ncbi:hypothetical protein [uncultured Rikenella sp.]|uniref:hypothetical protein n=1 Tax=uncultured Rikenella sp. TaxID=368003 RepID=UPI0026211064|nr:hypothetical protein [uncultured Rikenella sp.]
MPLRINGAGELSPEPIGNLKPGLGPGFLIQILRITRPAPGFRDAGENGRLGALMGVGNDGNSWSVSATKGSSLTMYFYLHGLYSGYANLRAYGFPLRCLSE